MESWVIKKKIEAVDKGRNVEICVSPDGKLFRYYVHVWNPVDESERLYHPDMGYWSCPEMSGYYSSLDDCENAARSNLGWLNS